MIDVHEPVVRFGQEVAEEPLSFDERKLPQVVTIERECRGRVPLALGAAAVIAIGVAATVLSR